MTAPLPRRTMKPLIDPSGVSITATTALTQVLSRLAAQHEEIVWLRNAADGANRVIRLPVNRATSIGPR